MAEVLKSGKRRTPEDGIAAFVQEEEVVEFFCRCRRRADVR
jgi:hypothetical protein